MAQNENSFYNAIPMATEFYGAERTFIILLKIASIFQSQLRF